MADPNDPIFSDDSQQNGDLPIESNYDVDDVDALDVEDAHPRRAASAEFIVKAETGAASVLREAMDPANQSLTEALRLSYRVLQLVIVILLGLFLVSGFRSIESGETGVKTLFGNIQTSDGAAELTPGLEVSLWPYPAAEFIVFPQTGSTTINATFWPDSQIGAKGSFEAAAPSTEFHANVRLGLGAGRDGFVLLADESLGHIQLQAVYAIRNPVQFVSRIPGEGTAARIVRMALERGVVHASAAMTLDEFIGQEEVVAELVKEEAQSFLNDLECGISLSVVQATSVKPPLAVQTALSQLGTARSDAERTLTEARTKANTLLVDMAGPEYQTLLDLIEQFEEAVLEAGDAGINGPEAQSALAQINAFFQSDQAGGNVATNLAAANAYRDEIFTALGHYSSRFESLLPRYRNNPDHVVKAEVVDAYRSVLGRRGAEIFYFPTLIGGVDIAVKSDYEAMQRARRARQGQAEAEAIGTSGVGPFEHRFGDRDKNRRLEIQEDGSVTGRTDN
ncbi:MAG: SPFH domain-containing protein [Phycisphaerales bacterium]